MELKKYEIMMNVVPMESFPVEIANRLGGPLHFTLAVLSTFLDIEDVEKHCQKYKMCECNLSVSSIVDVDFGNKAVAFLSMPRNTWDNLDSFRRHLGHIGLVREPLMPHVSVFTVDERPMEPICFPTIELRLAQDEFEVRKIS